MRSKTKEKKRMAKKKKVVDVEKFADDLFKQKVEKRSTQLPPEMFLGWRNGQVIDFEPYEDTGFSHPKQSGSYSMKDDFFKELHSNLKMRPYLDNPIHVYLHQDDDGKTKIVVIDGATRVSIISLLKKEDPSLFETVPVTYFCGDKDEAIADMVRLNLNGRHRPLSHMELINSIKRFLDFNWTQTLIAERLGLSVQKVHNLCKAIDNCKSEKLMEALDKKPDKFKMSAFLNACDQDEEKQEEIAEKVLGGKTVKAHNVKKHTMKQFLTQLNNVSTRILHPLTVAMRDRGQYDEDVALKDAMIEASDALDRIVEKLIEKFPKELGLETEEESEDFNVDDSGETGCLNIKAAYNAKGEDITDEVKQNSAKKKSKAKA
jgi:ParB-like chromosome segregation protein Spo0J